MLQVPLPRVRNANDGGRKAISRFASLRVCLVQCQQAIADRRSLGSSHGFSFMFEFSWLTLYTPCTSVHTHTHTHTHTRRVRICPELPQAGGLRVDADPTSSQRSLLSRRLMIPQSNVKRSASLCARRWRPQQIKCILRSSVQSFHNQFKYFYIS